MFDDILVSRNKKLNELFKLGSFLSRSLRENVELFKYDDSTDRVYFITESKKIISGIIKESTFSNLELQETDEYLNPDKLNKLVEAKVSNLIGNLYINKYSNANKDLNSLLNLWNSRLKIDKISKVLEKKSLSLTENKNILKQKETKSLIEIIPSLIKFLKEHKTKILECGEIKNGVKLSNTIANAFSLPKLTYKQLVETKKYEIPEDEQTNSIYSLITKQELLKKELLESKQNFNSIWISNDKVKILAESITKKEKEIHDALSRVFCEIPYFAFLSKKQLTEMFNLLLNPSDEMIPLKTIQEYSSYIFELKKPIRNELIKTLDEKYGINVQNLKEPASFKSLLNTQVVIFESICKFLPKGSPQRPVIKDFVKVLKEKNGVEAIDVNDLINKIFTESGYSLIKEDFMHRYLDFDAVANELMNVSNVLKMIKGGLGGQAPQMPQLGGGMPQPGQTPQTGGGLGGLGGGAKPPMPQMGGAKPPMGMPTPGKPDPTLGAHEEDLNSPAFTPEDDEAGISPESGMDQGMPGQTPPMELDQGQFAAALAELEELIGSLKLQMGEDPMQPDLGAEGGLDPSMGGAPGMEPDGDEFGEEGEEGEEGFEGGDINIDTGEGDDEVHVDKTKGTHDIENDEAADEETKSKPESKGKGNFPPKKDKGKSEKKPTKEPK